ncbi:MAG: MEKHLA domain-containing protein [Anaerolineae bacterium]|nr:MEKHLA domain-containing protein [Anaerolineae bacterium]
MIMNNALRVLMVDDSEPQHILVKSLLAAAKRIHFQVESASTYAAGLEMMIRNQHDVCLIDYLLDGDRNGVALIEEAQQLGCQTPVILLTGKGDYEIDLAAMRAGAVDYLDKTDLKPSVLERSIRYSVEQARTLKALRESEAQYRDLFENSTDLIQSLDLQGRFLYVNAHWHKVLGYTEQDLATMTLRDILPPTHTDSCYAVINQIASDQTNRNIETIFLTKDGREIIVEGNISCKVTNNQPSALRCMFRDITTRKQIEAAEHAQRLYLEGLRDTAVILNSTLNLNRILDLALLNVARIVTYETANIMLIDSGVAHVVRSKRFTDDHLDDTMPDIRLIIQQTPTLASMIKTGQPVVVGDVRAYPGWVDVAQTQWIRAYAGIPLQSEGEILGFLNLNSSVVNSFSFAHTERLEAFSNQIAIAVQNAKLYQQAEELAAFNERQRLARDLHDAVSQTLFSASMIAETLPRIWNKIPAAILEEKLKELHGLNRRALAEMRSLLIELRPKALFETSIQDLIRQLVETFANRTSIHVSTELDETITLSHEVKIAFYRIAQESLNNILKHAHADLVRVTLKLDSPTIFLEVMDNGRGFEADKPSARHFGMGIMYERAAGIQAKLEITSKIGGGTRVKMAWDITPSNSPN